MAATRNRVARLTEAGADSVLMSPVVGVSAVAGANEPYWSSPIFAAYAEDPAVSGSVASSGPVRLTGRRSLRRMKWPGVYGSDFSWI